MLPHPTSGEPPIEIGLPALLQLETGAALLRGWLRFTTSDRVHEISYNTRASRPLEKFLVALKRRWLHSFPTIENCGTQVYGQQLDIKFRNSLDFELEGDERPVVQYFEPPLKSAQKLFIFRREHWEGGNLVLLTSLNRFLWITDQHGGRRELYTSSSFSAPFALARNAVLLDDKTGTYWSIEFTLGRTWRIPLHGSESDCVAAEDSCYQKQPPVCVETRPVQKNRHQYSDQKRSSDVNQERSQWK